MDTIKFNVGGSLFEVSRALLNLQSESRLEKFVAGALSEDPENTVFIDRSGFLFAHVLEYLHYGSIELPASLPRAIFDVELGYYGLSSDEVWEVVFWR